MVWLGGRNGGLPLAIEIKHIKVIFIKQ